MRLTALPPRHLPRRARTVWVVELDDTPLELFMTRASARTWRYNNNYWEKGRVRTVKYRPVEGGAE